MSHAERQEEDDEDGDVVRRRAELALQGDRARYDEELMRQGYVQVAHIGAPEQTLHLRDALPADILVLEAGPEFMVDQPAKLRLIFEVLEPYSDKTDLRCRRVYARGPDGPRPAWWNFSILEECFLMASCTLAPDAIGGMSMVAKGRLTAGRWFMVGAKERFRDPISVPEQVLRSVTQWRRSLDA